MNYLRCKENKAYVYFSCYQLNFSYRDISNVAHNFPTAVKRTFCQVPKKNFWILREIEKKNTNNKPSDKVINSHPQLRRITHSTNFRHPSLVSTEHQPQQNELIAEADNVADSEDSEDEWNYYRPDDNNKTSSSLSGDSNAPANNIASNVVAKDPALVEKSDDQCEEKEPCSPTKDAEEEFASGSLEQHQQQYQHQQQAEEEEEEEHLLPENQPVSPAAGGEDDVTAEFDELHLKKEEEAEGEETHLELKDTDVSDFFTFFFLLQTVWILFF